MKRIFKLTLATLFIIHCSLFITNAQVAINTDNSTPDASSILDIKSTDKGVLVPRMTSSQRSMISNAATGLLVFDTTTESFWFKNSTVWVELAGNSNSPMERDATNQAVRANSSIVDYTNDDFVFGSPQLEDNTNANHDSRFLFDKSKGAFRAGVEEGNNWDGTNVGLSSTAMGKNNLASGTNSIAVGFGNQATESTTMAIGDQNVASQLYAVAVGSENLATAEGATAIGCVNSATAQGASVFGEFSEANGIASLALGSYVFANGDGSVALGTENTASGIFAQAYGSWNTAPSAFETVMGYYNTTYSPSSAQSPAPTDRLFVIGNGTPFSRSDALVMLKNGSTRINGPLTLGLSGSQPIDLSYTFPNLKGSTGQILQLNGNVMQWADIPSSTALADTDNDTKIQVEESADEDIIRFDIKGTEFMRLDSGRVEVLNTGGAIFIGENAGLKSNAVYNHNVGIGEEALKNTTTGNSNIAVGLQALAENTTGSYNLALGRAALAFTTGSSNIALGDGALLQNTIGGKNVSIGRFSGLQVIGSENVYIGHEAGFSNNWFSADIYSKNVMIGYQSGYRHEGDGNVFLGYRAGYNEAGDNKLYIENSNANANNALIYGEFDNDLVRINGDLEVTGSYPGTDDQTLAFDGTSISIEDGNAVDISSIDTNTDNQTLSYDNANNSLSISGGNSVSLPSSTVGVPVGCIMMWYMNENTVPQDWLICDNRLYNTTEYDELFALLGTDRTPDFAGRFPIGPKDGIAIPGDPIPESIVLRQAGGSQFITIDENNLPPHSHGVTITYREGSENGGGNDYSDLGDTGSSTDYTTDDGGFANDPINILPPWRGVFFIIKAK